jgi:hypothetical protein
MEGIQVCSNKWDSSRSPRGDNSERVKIHRKFLRIFSPEPAGQISQIWYTLSLDEGKPSLFKYDPLQRGDDYKNVKMGLGHLKIFTRTTESILSRFRTNHL